MKPSRPVRTQVLFVYPTDATFIENDLRLIETFCDVTPFRYTDRSCYPGLFRSIARSDLVFMWFALGFAAVSGLVARLVKKATLLVAGGWDVRLRASPDYEGDHHGCHRSVFSGRSLGFL